MYENYILRKILFLFKKKKNCMLGTDRQVQVHIDNIPTCIHMVVSCDMVLIAKSKTSIEVYLVYGCVLPSKVVKTLSRGWNSLFMLFTNFFLLLYILEFYPNLVFYSVPGDTSSSVHMACFLASILKSLFNVTLVSTF